MIESINSGFSLDNFNNYEYLLDD